MKNLTAIDHIAIESNDIAKSVDWYKNNFNCKVKYQDKSWAMLEFENLSVALVVPGQHPPHFAVVDETIGKLPKTKVHRDGIKYLYETDPDKNYIERIDKPS